VLHKKLFWAMDIPLPTFSSLPFGQVVAGRPGVVGRLRNRTGGSMFWATGQEELLPNKLHAA
jgi:hypothetical protein